MPQSPGVDDCARRLLALLDEVGDDVLAREAELSDALRDVLALPQFEASAPLQEAESHGTPQARVSSLYDDGDLRIIRGDVPAGMAQKPHNHGGWNLFGVRRGALKYRSYRRLDDGSMPYFADLEIAEDRILRDGDVTILPGPPHDIHAVMGLAPMTTTVLVARGAFQAIREQYIPEQRCYTREPGDVAARG